MTSTNEVVKNALREGKAEGLIVARPAPVQRLRPPGSRMGQSRRAACTCPSCLRPDVAGSGLATLSLVVGLSVQRALGQVAAPQFEDGIQVKWPNDVIYMPADCRARRRVPASSAASRWRPAGAACAWASASTCAAAEVDRPVHNVARVDGGKHTSPGSEPGPSSRLRGSGARRECGRREILHDVTRRCTSCTTADGRARLRADVAGELRRPMPASPGAAVRIGGRSPASRWLEGTVATGVDARGRLVLRAARRDRARRSPPARPIVVVDQPPVGE